MILTELELQKKSEEALQLKNLNQKLDRSVFELAVLHEIGKTINSTLETEKIVSIFAEMTRQAFNAQFVRILVFRQDHVKPDINLVQTGDERQPCMTLAEKRIVATICEEKKPVLSAAADKTFFINLGLPSSDTFLNSWMAVPFIRKGEILGVMILANPSASQPFTHDDLRFVKTLADQASISLEKNRLFEELQEYFTDTIRVLITTLEAKDRDNLGHSDRVAAFSLSLGKALNMPAPALRRLECLALLHDAGKIGIDEKILAKPGELSAHEWEMIKQHPETGAGIVGTIRLLQDDSDAILHHHEWYNGDGYPAGLSGERIPMMARIISIADAFDAMTHDRPYRSRLNIKDAKVELWRQAGKQFDPMMVSTFLNTLGA